MSKLHGIIFSFNRSSYNRSAGAHKIATHLRHQGWDIEVVDFSDMFNLEDLQELVKSRVSSRTIFIGYSSFFSYWPDVAQQLASWVKRKYPNISNIMGGQSCLLTNAVDIDYWIDSYAEVAITELLKNLTASGSTPLKFDPYFLKQGKKVIRAIHNYPAYPSDSYLNVFEKRDFVSPWEWGTVEFSRGCKFKCDFCNFPIIGVKGDYSRSAKDFEYEMRYNYDNFGISQYHIADETFNDRPEKIKKFADVAETLNFKPWFSGFIRADLLFSKPETWDDINRLGMHGQFYGVESFNHPSLKVIHKGMHPDKVKQGLVDYQNYMKNERFRAGLGMIVGLPFETEETINSTRTWLLENWTDHHLDPYVLDIGPDVVDDLNGLTNVSSFRKNLEKYGLRKMQTSETLRFKKFNKSANTGNLGLPGVGSGGKEGREETTEIDNVFRWEHDTMNIYQAKDIWVEWNEEVIENFKPGPFQLTKLSGIYRQTIRDIEDFENITLESYPQDSSIQRQFINEYISKKLNLY